MDGKTKCRILKGIRQRIADINGINYEHIPAQTLVSVKALVPNVKKN